jgi:proline iminopeptidase
VHEGRTWSEVYESLKSSFDDWIHQPESFRRLADTAVPMAVVAAIEDLQPDWPLRQLAALVPRGEFREITGVPHNFWSTHPATWTEVVSGLCAAGIGTNG